MRHAIVLAGLISAVAGSAPAQQAPAVCEPVDPPPSGALSSVFPERALRMGRGGEATLTCKVMADRTLGDCRVVAENPRGYGFGQGAMKLADQKVLRRSACGEKASPVGAEVTFPVRFRVL